MTARPYSLNIPRPASGLQTHRGAVLSRVETLASIDKLNTLRQIIYRHYDDILQALREDHPLRSRTDLELGEVVVTLQRINLVILSLKSGLHTPASPAAHKTPQLQKPAKLISAEDSAPFRSVFMPLINVISTGQSAILRPTACAPAIGRLIAHIIAAAFAPDDVMIWQDAALEPASYCNALTQLPQLHKPLFNTLITPQTANL